MNILQTKTGKRNQRESPREIENTYVQNAA